MKALAPRIEDRHPTVAAFQQDLRDVLANSQSMAIARRAADQLAAVRQSLLDPSAPDPLAPKRVDKHTAAISYGLLSECIGSYRQAIELWSGNLEARQGLLDALALQIRLALRHDDLTLARAQCRLLESLSPDGLHPALAADMDRLARELGAQIEARQALLDRAARLARRWKSAAAALAFLTLAGLAAIVVLSLRQRTLAIQSEKDMFAASVTARAQMLAQFMAGIEQIAQLYRQTAVELMSSPPDRLPWRDPTPAGRDGFYFDEDFAAPRTQPPDMAHNPRYGTRLSMTYPTVVRAPWARDDSHRAAVEDTAARLGRLNTLFSHFHRSRRDIQWSIAGSESGILLGFPGYSRYQDKPDYDPTRRIWYLSAIHATNDHPVWGQPYADATTQLMLMSCMCRIHVHDRTVGAVGLEITLDTLQRLLLDFSLSVGGKRRGLLVRPSEETDPATGNTRTFHRIVVDTRYPRTAANRQTQIELAAIQQAGPDVADFYFEALAGHHRPGVCVEKENLWLAFMPIQNRAWTFIAILEKDR